MITWKRIKFNLKQIFAIAEKEVKLSFRFKLNVIMNYLHPFLTIIFPFIIMGKFFSYQANFGPWNQKNYVIYLVIGYNILLLQNIVSRIGSKFSVEKYWLTLQALLIAPFNRLNFLLGLVFAFLIESSIPFVFFLILLYILYPVSIMTLIIVILMFFIILIIFSGFGFMLGAYTISNPNMSRILFTLVSFLFMFSCISYPYQIFPEIIQFFVLNNPIYYWIDFIRLIWLENDFFFTVLSHLFHFILLLIGFFFMPIIGISIFNHLFKKYGITGY